MLAVINRYVECLPAVTFAELERVFPMHCQGALGVFTTAEKANEIYTLTSRKRHFIEASELIQLDDGTIAVCSQWGACNIDQFIAHAQNLVSEIARVVE